MERYKIHQQYEDLKTRMPKQKEAIDYLNELGINYKMIDVAYQPNETNDTLFPKGSLIFPKYNKAKEVVSFYAKNIKNKNDLLLNNRGLYPKYPATTCKHLLVTETIIDAASILQHKKIYDGVVALNKYGDTPDDLFDAIGKASQLRQITFVIGETHPNQNYIYELMQKIEDVKPYLQYSLIELPKGQSLQQYQKHKTLMNLYSLIESRKLLSFNREMYFKPDSKCIRGKYKNIELLVLGGINGNDLDRCNLDVKITINHHSAFKRVSLFQYKKLDAFSKQIANQTNTNKEDIKQALTQFLERIEEYCMDEGYVL
jgi:DNA primase